MKVKRDSAENLDEFYQNIKDEKIETKIQFKQKIYYDGKQHSCKLSKKMMDYIEFKYGDYLLFTIDISGVPKIDKIEYQHEK